MKSKRRHIYTILLLCSLILVLCTPTSAFAAKTSTPKSIKLNYREYDLVKGKSIQLKVFHLPSSYKVTYQSNKPSIASVNSKGIVTGRKKGKATITVYLKNRTKTVRRLTCSIEVGNPAVSVVISKSSLTLKKNKSTYLKVFVKPTRTTEVPTYKSSNPKIATVNKNGLVKAIAPGKAIITAKISNGKKDTCKIHVTK